MLEKTLERPLDCKEIKPVHPKGNQSWIFIGRTDAEAETPILWPPDANNWLIWKDTDAGKDWRQEEKGMTEDEMVGCHHWISGDEFEWTPGVGDGQGDLVSCSPSDHRVGHNCMTELNWTSSGVFVHWTSNHRFFPLITRMRSVPKGKWILFPEICIFSKGTPDWKGMRTPF